MRDFAQAVNAYAQFLRGVPSSLCIGPSNRANFDALQGAITSATNVSERGIGLFESNFDRYSTTATSLLAAILDASKAINAQSRDFTPVASSVTAYRRFVSSYNVEVWNLSQRIKAQAEALQSNSVSADAALKNAVAQIETNVEGEARTISQQAKNCEAAYDVWERVDGKDGYVRFMDTARFTAQILVPAFNAFLQRVPRTARIQAAVGRAQEALDYISTNVDSFPTYPPLPSASDAFPYESYGREERKFGNQNIIGILQLACSAHYAATGRKLMIGDMQYEHGGRVDPHRSHREGRDADVDPVEIGNVPNHNRALALEAAKRFLTAGAHLVFYADQSVVSDANDWAQANGIGGRLQYEANHTSHFHLRAPQ
ncbi:MAG: penicillin-insensitive murein endopeptidase [Myxococcota bacterium]